MISPLRATAIVGMGTLVTLAASVVVAKSLAIFIGPEGVGVYGLFSSVLGLATLVAGLGIGTGLVRGIASALSQSGDERVAAIRRGGVLIALAAGVTGALVLIGLREPIAEVALGSTDRASSMFALALALPLYLLAGVELGVLNGYHRVRELTLAGAISAVIGGGITIACVAALGEDGIAPAILGSASVAAVIAVLLRLRSVGRTASASGHSIRLAAGSLLRFGGPFTASQLVGTGAQLLIPILILSQVGAAGVGHYRAAATIAIGYLAFLLTAMAQDYYPRVAGAAEMDLSALIERRTRIVVAIAAPIILAMLALSPLIVALLYTDEFLPAVDVLQWQLIGDLLKLPAWALSFVILARASSLTFLSLELVGGAALVAGVLLLTPVLGVAGTGVAYLVMYAAYYVAAWLLVQRVVRVGPGRLQLAIVLLAGGCTVVLLAAPEVSVLRSGLLLLVAASIAFVAWPRLWRHHRAGVLA